jgi:hypothetical protein
MGMDTKDRLILQLGKRCKDLNEALRLRGNYIENLKNENRKLRQTIEAIGYESAKTENEVYQSYELYRCENGQFSLAGRMQLAAHYVANQ